MKQKIFKSVVMVIAVTASGFGIWQAHHSYEVSASALLAENIEALSFLEGSGNDEGCQRSEPIIQQGSKCGLCGNTTSIKGTKYWCGYSGSTKKCKNGEKTYSYPCSCQKGQPPTQINVPNEITCPSL